MGSKTDIRQCLICKREWDDSIPTSMTPAPIARCPFEWFHDTHPLGEDLPDDWPVKEVKGDSYIDLEVEWNSQVYEFRIPKMTLYKRIDKYLGTWGNTHDIRVCVKLDSKEDE